MRIGFLSYAHLGISTMMPGGGGVTNELIKSVLEEAGHEVDFLRYRLGGMEIFGMGKVAAKINRLAASHAWRNARDINERAKRYDVLICESSVCHRISHPCCINLFHFINRGYLDYGGVSLRTPLKFVKFSVFALIECHEAKGKFNVAVSEFSKKILNSQGVDVFRVIPNAVDTEKFRPSRTARERTGCLFVGSFSRHGKGFDVLEKLAARGGAIDCITDREAGIESGLTYLGPANHGELPEIYNRHRILIFPSRFENCALAPLEAMACGLPVVMSNVGGAEELRRVIPEFVVDGYDDAAVEEYLRRIAIIEEKYEEFSLRARQYAEENHSLRRFREDWLELVNDVSVRRK